MMKNLIAFGGVIAVVVGFVAVGSAQAAEKEFVYAQATGKFTLDGKELTTGYSGHGEGKNNPAMENVRGVGPIPAGLWRISKPREYKEMKDCFDLEPIGHDAHGRTEFLIHGDSKTHPGSRSIGCIVLDQPTREKIAESGITLLRVVPR